MEAFSLLKYWRGGGGVAGVNSKPTTTIVTTEEMEIQNDTKTPQNNDNNNNDDGPFFDLEFSLEEEEEEEEDDTKSTKSESEEEEEREFNFTISPDRTEELFFKGNIVPIEDSSETDQTSTSTKPPQPQFSSLLKSATRFRVFMSNKKLFTVKFKVEEVPIVSSLFTRDNSSRLKQAPPPKHPASDSETATTVSEEKRFSREAVGRYLKKVKPLYVRRNGEKVRLAGNAADGGSPAAEGGGGMNLPAGLRVVCKHLGKSRSASAAVVAVVPPVTTTVAARRRDDSLIQQQDGIQSAILHCKRSFNATRDSESSLLSRCASDPSNEKKCLDLSRKSSDGIQRP